MDDEKRLEEIEARLEAATEGPWQADIRNGCAAVYPGEHRNCLDVSRPHKVFLLYHHGYKTEPNKEYPSGYWTLDPQAEADVRFVGNSRQDIPWLISELRKAWAIVDKLPRTADGVSVVPGMELWRPDEGAGPDEGFVSCDYVKNLCVTRQVEMRWTNGGAGGTPQCNWGLASDWYSTREAARAALEGTQHKDNTNVSNR